MNDRQRRDLLAALTDDSSSSVISELLRGPATQQQLASATGVDQTGVSRTLKHLRALGLVRSDRGKDAQHSVIGRSELFAVLKAADGLARVVNEERDRSQREVARQTVRDELRAPAREVDRDSAG